MAIPPQVVAALTTAIQDQFNRALTRRIGLRRDHAGAVMSQLSWLSGVRGDPYLQRKFAEAPPALGSTLGAAAYYLPRHPEIAGPLNALLSGQLYLSAGAPVGEAEKIVGQNAYVVRGTTTPIELNRWYTLGTGTDVRRSLINVRSGAYTYSFRPTPQYQNAPPPFSTLAGLGTVPITWWPR